MIFVLFSRLLYLLISIFTTQPHPCHLSPAGLNMRISGSDGLYVRCSVDGRVENNHHVFLEICDLITFTPVAPAITPKSLSLITRFFPSKRGKNNVSPELISLVFRSFFFFFFRFRFRFIIVVLFLLYQHLFLPSNVPPGMRFLNEKQRGNDTFNIPRILIV